MKFADAFCGRLDEVKCRYELRSDSDGQEMLFLGISGDNFNGLQCFILFDDDTSAQLQCQICKAAPDKNLMILQTVNQLNNKFRWAKFSASASGIVGVKADVKATEDTAAEVLFHVLCVMNAVIDESYPILMKVIYS